MGRYKNGDSKYNLKHISDERVYNFKMKNLAKLKILLVTILFLFCGCQMENNSNEYFEKKYNLEFEKLNLYKMSYNEFLNMENQKEKKVFIIVIRNDCQACHEFLMEFDRQLLESNEQLNKIYVLESDLFTEYERINFITTYSLSTVPLIMIFENGEFTSVDIGLPSIKRLSELIKIYE